MKKLFLTLVLLNISFAQDLKIYNWSDYITKNAIQKFKEKTNINVIYDVFDNNEVLEAKLFSGNSGYDIVVPSSQFLSRQIRAKVYQPLDKTKLKNYSNLDPTLMEKIATSDPENKYSIPYMWGTTGIGYNTDKIKERLGVSEIDSWDIFFKVENIEKLKDCGVASLDAPQEIIAAALHYLGEDPNSSDEKTIQKAQNKLLEIRPFISYFHSSKFISDLANGDICMVLGWSGDILQAKDRAIEAKNGVNIAYSIPKEGAAAFFDVMAIPATATNTDAAYQFLDYLLEPQVIAPISDYLLYSNANKQSLPFVNEQIKNNPNIYPTEDIMKKLYLFKEQNTKTLRVITKAWNKIKSSQ